MSEVDHGIAAAIGGAVVGAAAAVKDLIVARRKRRSEDEDVGMAARVAALERKVTAMEKALEKLDELDESVEQLCMSRARTDELLPIVREQLKELRADLRAHTRREK